MAGSGVRVSEGWPSRAYDSQTKSFVTLGECRPAFRLLHYDTLSLDNYQYSPITSAVLA